MSSRGDITGRATATPISSERYALEFRLSNRGSSAASLSYLDPFTQFEVIARTSGGEVAARKPTLDLVVQDVVVEVPPGGTIDLSPPIQLRIREGAAQGPDGFVWTLPVRLDDASVEVRFTLPAPFDISCRLQFVDAEDTAAPAS